MAGNSAGTGVDTESDSAYTGTDMKTTREYRMLRRGEAVAGTRRSIPDAVVALGYDQLDLDPARGRVAAKAGVSGQTVLRHFGSRAALLDEAVTTAQAE